MLTSGTDFQRLGIKFKGSGGAMPSQFKDIDLLFGAGKFEALR